MGRIVAWTLSLTGGIVVVRDPCLHGRFSIGSLCVGPSDTMSWSPTIGLLITPQEPIQPRLGGRVERFLNTYGTEVVVPNAYRGYSVLWGHRSFEGSSPAAPVALTAKALTCPPPPHVSKHPHGRTGVR